jgi:hypothetical protein
MMRDRAAAFCALTAKHCRDSVSAIVRFEAQRLLLSLVPYAHDQNKSWVHNSFEEAQKESVGCYASKVRAGWRCDENDAPDDGRD